MAKLLILDVIGMVLVLLWDISLLFIGLQVKPI
jgi:hypothetical protein